MFLFVDLKLKIYLIIKLICGCCVMELNIKEPMIYGSVFEYLKYFWSNKLQTVITWRITRVFSPLVTTVSANTAAELLPSTAVHSAAALTDTQALVAGLSSWTQVSTLLHMRTHRPLDRVSLLSCTHLYHTWFTTTVNYMFTYVNYF